MGFESEARVRFGSLGHWSKTTFACADLAWVVNLGWDLQDKPRVLLMFDTYLHKRVKAFGLGVRGIGPDNRNSATTMAFIG